MMHLKNLKEVSLGILTNRQTNSKTVVVDPFCETEGKKMEGLFTLDQGLSTYLNCTKAKYLQ